MGTETIESDRYLPAEALINQRRYDEAMRVYMGDTSDFMKSACAFCDEAEQRGGISGDAEDGFRSWLLQRGTDVTVERIEQIRQRLKA